MRSDPLSRPRLSRRAALAGLAGLAGTTACTPSRDDPGAEGDQVVVPRSEPDPDIALAATVLADELDLLARIDAATVAHPVLAAVLAPARAGHEAHAAVLRDAVPASAQPSPGPAPSTPAPSSAPSSAAPAVEVPGTPRRALADLARREDRLAVTGRRSAFAAQSGAFARVLASMAAAAAQQAVVLAGAELPAPDRGDRR